MPKLFQEMESELLLFVETLINHPGRIIHDMIYRKVSMLMQLKRHGIS